MKKGSDYIQETICCCDKGVQIGGKGTKFFKLSSKDKSIMPNVKSFYPGLDTLGKHFTVKWMQSHGRAKRHYTICNVMRPEVYNAVVKHLKAGTKAFNAPGNLHSFTPDQS